jgi:hypothetical protein
MPLPDSEEFFEGKLVSQKCSEEVGEFFESQLRRSYVKEEGNGIVAADFTMDGDTGWLALVVEEDEETIEEAKRILHGAVRRPIDWSGE